MGERILIVEDEEKIARVVQLELEFEGYESEIAKQVQRQWKSSAMVTGI